MAKSSNKQIQELQTALRTKKFPEVQRARIKMILLREQGLTQAEVADVMGVSVSTVNRIHMTYNVGGIEALEPKPIGGRQRENMPLQKEKALLERFSEAAESGTLLNIQPIKAAYEKAVGRPTSNSTIYNLLSRHGWRKLRPHSAPRKKVKQR